MEKNDVLPDKDKTAAPQVIIYEADFSLQKKLGPRTSLEDILTPQIVEEAEKTIAAMEPLLLDQVLSDMRRLKEEAADLEPASIPVLIEMSFAVKSNAGLCNYPLASALAKSLHLFCETLNPGAALGTKENEIIGCLVNALQTIFDQRVTGTGGTTGEAITAELKRLAIRFS